MSDTYSTNLIKKEIKTIFPNKKIKSIKKINKGKQNYNFYFNILNKHYILRIKEYNKAKYVKKEYNTLSRFNKFIPEHVPKVYFYKKSGKFIKEAYIIIEYVIGNTIKFNQKTIKELAKTIAKLHTQRIRLYDLLFTDKKNHKTINKLMLKRTKKSVKKLNIPNIFQIYKNIIKVDITTNSKLSYIHLDLHQPNIICKKNKIKLIDWEFSEIGDPANDISKLCFNSVFYKYKNTFYKEYIKITKDNNIETRVNNYMIFQAYTWILSDINAYIKKRKLNSKVKIKKEITKCFNFLKEKGYTNNIKKEYILNNIK